MNSIRRQLLRELLTVTLLLVGGGLCVLYLAARETAIDQFDFALRTKAFTVSTLTTVDADGVHLDFSDRFFRGFDNRRPRDFFELWSADGKVVARSESLRRSDQLPPVVGSQAHPRRWNLRLPSGRAGRAIGFSFRPRARSPGLHGHEPALLLVVASDRDELDETLWELLALAATCAALLVIATLWCVPRVLGRGLRSIERLAEQAGRIDARSLGFRFAAEEMPSELQPIARRLNDLLARLEASFQRERQFSADLAHELRTPIAELRSLAECALKWPESRDASTDRDTLAIAKHMERLASHILALARADQGQSAATIAPVALEPLVRESWRSFSSRAAKRELRSHLNLQPSTALGDESLLRSILFNLYDNAVEYAPDGGSVEIGLRSAPSQSVITVANDAPDMEADDVSKLFDRLWRKEQARTGGQHFGLGLPLARSFAEAIGWTLTAALHERRLVVELAGRRESDSRTEKFA